MNNHIKNKAVRRIRRHAGVRARISGTKERPRLCVYRTIRYVYAQLIDDASGKTIASAHSKTTPVQPVEGKSGKIAASYTVGKVIAERAKQAGIESVVFDRSGYLYHGRVSAVADGARDGGLVF